MAKKEVDILMWVLILLNIFFIWWYLQGSLFWVIIWGIIVFLIFKGASSKIAGELVTTGVKKGIKGLFTIGGITAFFATLSPIGWIFLIVGFILLVLFFGWSILIFIQMIPIALFVGVSYVVYHLLKGKI